MGNLGLATSFFNDKNRNLVRDLVELIVETKQELPSWLDEMASDQRMPHSGRRGGGSKRFIYIYKYQYIILLIIVFNMFSNVNIFYFIAVGSAVADLDLEITVNNQVEEVVVLQLAIDQAAEADMVCLI